MTQMCAECGSDSEHLHFENDRSSDTICCDCFKQRFRFHDACTHDACADGAHTLEYQGAAMRPVCTDCNLSAQTLSDYLGHDLTPTGSTSSTADARDDGISTVRTDISDFGGDADD
jgi:hypothetical protein